jgi:hypothetical protein
MERFSMQHTVERALDQRPIVIEVSGEPQGVVVPAAGRFRFVAVKLPVFAIDGREFGSVEEAQAAAKAAVGGS